MLADRVRRAVERQAADLVDYLLEYVPCVRAQFLQKTVLDAPTVVRLAQLINANAVCVFTRPGCGWCTKAKALVVEHAQDVPTTFVTASPDGNLKMHLALRAALGREGPPTYPVVVVRGTFVGGCDDLERLVAANAFAGRLAAPHVRYEGVPARLPHDAVLDRRFDVSLDAKGRSACRFQFGAFANAVRAYALLYVALQLATAVLAPSRAAAALLVFMAVDSSLFILLGPTPASPLGVAATRLAWTRRGGVVPALPYKVVWAAYVAACAVGLRREESARATMFASASNSALLAAFRF